MRKKLLPQILFFFRATKQHRDWWAWRLSRRKVYLKATQSLKSKFRPRRPKLPVAFSDFRNNRKQPRPPPPNAFGPTDVYCICDRARSIRLAHCNQIQCFAWLTAFLCAVRTSQINTVLGQKPHLTCGQVAWVSQSSSQGRNCVFQKILRIEAWQRRKC